MDARPVVLVLDTVSIRYGTLSAVEQLAFQVQAGELVGLLGPNGSGKSTTLNAIAGLLQPSSGKISIHGISHTDAADEYASRIGFVPQEPAVYEELSALENLLFFGRLYGLTRTESQQRANRLLQQVGLADRARERAETFSGGMLRRLNLACALVHRPSVLLLDEPTVALDVTARQQFFSLLDQLRQEGCAILLTTHHLEEAEQWCDRVALLQKGRLQAFGRWADLERGDPSWVLEVILREEMDELQETRLRERLGSDLSLFLDGRQLKIRASYGEQLGYALATLFAEGVAVESFRTPKPLNAVIQGTLSPFPQTVAA